MMLPLTIAATLIALPIGDAREGGGPPSPAEMEDCVYDRALEYFTNKQSQTDESDAKAQKILLDICIGHGLPLLPHESPAVQRGLDRAFEEAIEELVLKR